MQRAVLVSAFGAEPVLGEKPKPQPYQPTPPLPGLERAQRRLRVLQKGSPVQTPRGWRPR